MESGLGAGKSCRMNQMVAALQTCAHVFGHYMHFHCYWTLFLPVFDLVTYRHSYARLTTYSVYLQLSFETCRNVLALHTQGNWFGKCMWKSDLFDIHICTSLNSPGKTGKMDIKRSWKVMEHHFQCSVCTLLIMYGLWLGLHTDRKTPVINLARYILSLRKVLS